MNFFRHTLEDLRQSGLLRELRTVDGPQGPTIRVGGREVVCLCSNNYLSLASHPELAEAAARAARELGCGAGASRLVSGTMAIHAELEAAVARVKHRDAAIVFPTGYMANLGAISALVSHDDAVIVDKLNHASIIDGCRLSGAKLLVYPHCDAGKLDRVLQTASRYRRRLVVTDTVFSMDGDVVPLPEIADVCARHDAMLMIDEAHATGVLGATGRGTEEHFGMLGHPPSAGIIVMGTLSKAIGSIGGFVAGSSDLIDYLRNLARSFVYTTALPPPACAASLAAIRLIERDPRPLASLRANVRLLDELLIDAGMIDRKNAGRLTPIFPIRIGDAARAMNVSRRLFEAGYLCPAIRPPTVPAGTSRLRASVQAGHTEAQLTGFVQALLAALRE